MLLSAFPTTRCFFYSLRKINTCQSVYFGSELCTSRIPKLGVSSGERKSRIIEKRNKIAGSKPSNSAYLFMVWETVSSQMKLMKRDGFFEPPLYKDAPKLARYCFEVNVFFCGCQELCDFTMKKRN